MGQNLGQFVAHRAVHHALARRAVDLEMAGTLLFLASAEKREAYPIVNVNSFVCLSFIH